MNLIKPVVGIATKYAPEILTGIGLALMGVAVVEAVENTSKMNQALEDEKNKKALALIAKDEVNSVDEVELTNVEKFIIIVKSQAVTMLCFIGGGFFIVGAQKMSLDRIATFALAADAYKNKLKEKDENEKEFLSEKRYGELQEYSARKSIEKEYDKTTGLLPESPDGTMWIVDKSYGGKFIDNPGDVTARIERLRREIDGGRTLTVNEFREEISNGALEGDRTGGFDKGWNFDGCDSGDSLDVNISVVKDPAGQQCCVVSYIEPNINVGKPVRYM